MISITVHPGALSALLDWYATLTPPSLDGIARFYASDAQFTDPFNNVRGHAAMRRMFEHMFETVDAPRFRIQSQVMGQDEGFATWIFTGTARGKVFSVQGSSHLRFGADGRVNMHCDYWDAAALWRQ